MSSGRKPALLCSSEIVRCTVRACQAFDTARLARLDFRTSYQTTSPLCGRDRHDAVAAPDGGGAGAGEGAVMDYDLVFEQALSLLQREHRLSYRVLKRRLQLDDDTLADLKEDLIHAKKLAVDENGKVLVWVGEAGATV